MTEFQKQILEAIIIVFETNESRGVKGVTPGQVFEQMQRRGEIIDGVTLVSVAREIVAMKDRGWLLQGDKRLHQLFTGVEPPRQTLIAAREIRGDGVIDPRIYVMPHVVSKSPDASNGGTSGETQREPAETDDAPDCN